jgi:hypothetical protein
MEYSFAPLSREMGRYAFFNTGFEYKFAFGTQSSAELMLFGGEYVSFPDHCHQMIWEAPFDLYTCRNILDEMEKERGYPPFDLSDYSRTLAGTERVHAELREKGGFTDTYILGLLIYHQLQYMPYLTGRFE